MTQASVLLGLGGSAFAAPDVHAKEILAPTTYTIGNTPTDRQLNTLERNANGIASLGSFALSLPAGTYYFEARAFSSSATINRFRRHFLRNVTAGADIVTGPEVGDASTNAVAYDGAFSGTFTLGVSSQIKLQGVSNAGTSTPGTAGSVVALLSELKLWKLA